MVQKLPKWEEPVRGWLGSDMYSTAWAASVPAAEDASAPAWPQALDYLRWAQLEDGGWGDPLVYYAHERTISTMAAIWALSLWADSAQDEHRIERGLEALHRYADDMPQEPHEPIGFELLLPRLREELAQFAGRLPVEKWAAVDEKTRQKMKLIQSLTPDPDNQMTWWFSMEMLPEARLAELNDDLLGADGDLATAPAATAAYLRALRRAGKDSPCAAAWLEKMLALGRGSVPVGWPFDVFERIWVADAFMRADLDPQEPTIKAMLESIRASWDINEPGLAYSDTFRVNDGDDTLVGFAALNWGGMAPPEDPVLAFWDKDHFRSYLDERSASVSVNIHALTALRAQPGFPHEDLAVALTGWLIEQAGPDCVFDDKWHFSPYYSISHAISAFAGWNDAVALACAAHVCAAQQEDGGWGRFENSTLEETAHCVLGLYQAHKYGLLDDMQPFERAADFFRARAGRYPAERLWIGKTLYRPGSIVEATIYAAKCVLVRFGCDLEAEPEPVKQLNHVTVPHFGR